MKGRGTRSRRPGPSSASVAERVAEVRDGVAAALRRSARPRGVVRLVAVTKGVEVERIREVLAAGVADLGESRAQELVAKAPDLAAHAPAWHFVGRLQRNKVPALAPVVALWHSVDRLEAGRAIARRRPGARVLVEVNVAADPHKGGCRPEEASGLVAALGGYGLVVAGLMTVPAREVDPRPAFAALRALAEDLQLAELSMGMSDDYEAAVEEGATMIRVGRAIFGPRAAAPGVPR